MATTRGSRSREGGVLHWRRPGAARNQQLTIGHWSRPQPLRYLQRWSLPGTPAILPLRYRCLRAGSPQHRLAAAPCNIRKRLPLANPPWLLCGTKPPAHSLCRMYRPALRTRVSIAPVSAARHRSMMVYFGPAASSQAIALGFWSVKPRPARIGIRTLFLAPGTVTSQDVRT